MLDCPPGFDGNRMSVSCAGVRRGLIFLFIACWALGASAQDPAVPDAGKFYLVGTLGQSEYTSDSGFVACRCRSDKSQALRLGGGYRFGVSAVEVWLLDFGKATLAGDALGPDRTVRIRAAVLGLAWTTRLGSRVEANWRVGAASVSTRGSELASTRSVRPIVGAALGLRLTESVIGELSLDVTSAKDGAGSPTDVAALGLGLRYHF